MISQFGSHAFLAVSAVLAATAPGARAQAAAEARERDLREQVAALNAEVQSARASLVEAIHVNGVRLDPRRVLREAVFLMGGKLVEAKVMEFFIEEQIDLAIKGGRDPADLEISEDEVLSTLASAQARFAEQNPGVDFREALRAQMGLDWESLIHQQRQGMLFERVFFPGTPSTWPLITREAIIAANGGQNGQAYLDNLEKNMRDPQGNPTALPPLFTQMMRQWVEKQLREWSDVRYPSDGLPDDQILSVNGLVWHVEDAFEYVRPGLFPQDMERALAEVVIREALRQELEKSGHLIDLDEFKKRWDVYREPYDSTPFNTTLIAVSFKGYPCLEAYKQRWRLISSFRDMIADDITDENLRAHAERFKALFGDGKVSCEVIPFMGKDPATGAWRPDGMELARRRAEAAFELLQSGEVTFEDLKDEYAEFPANNEDRGILQYKPVNQLRQRLGENEFTDLLLGYGVSNYLFYDAEVGKAVGPLRGPDTYYIARVNLRSPPYRETDLEDANKREVIEEDYVNWRFLQWANDVLAETVIE